MWIIINAMNTHFVPMKTALMKLKIQVLTFNALWNEVKCTILATNVLVSAVDPDISGLDQILWQFQRQITVQHFFVDQSIWR